ncbi:MAG: NAD(P)-dependent oxidoreductase [Deltaproteobacteria bacterium]|jgi:nucleoside-diphosphate-sugar epimerase|nr:NAD(P)-dependent oxidoreductase [Deltaproteobacteria bacterium]
MIPEQGESVLVVGGAGYIGQVLDLELLKAGYKITSLDANIHGEQDLSLLTSFPNFTQLTGDIRDQGLVAELAQKFDSIIFLASLVGEAACNLNFNDTIQVNYLAPLNWWTAVKYFGRAKRFIFTSTDSCYGQRPGERLREESELLPLSLYGELKAKVEKELLASQDGKTAPIVLRLATVYGLAPRMRFDLVVNLLTRDACFRKKLTIFSGDQWRPLVHVSDVARAFHMALDSPLEKVKGQVFNVGSNENNIQFKDLGKIITDCIPGSHLKILPGDPDLRDYYVDFTKINKVLGFSPKVSLRSGILELAAALKAGVFADPYNKRYANA